MKAAGYRYNEAQNFLGFCYETGNGIEKNLTTAKEWYKKAAEMESQGAQDAIRRIG